MVVSPGVMILSLNASVIMAHAVDCRRRYQAARSFTMVAMYSTATRGSAVSFPAHSEPRPSLIASSSPACRPELNAIWGIRIHDDRPGLLLLEHRPKIAPDLGRVVNPGIGAGALGGVGQEEQGAPSAGRELLRRLERPENSLLCVLLLAYLQRGC